MGWWNFFILVSSSTNGQSCISCLSCQRYCFRRCSSSSRTSWDNSSAKIRRIKAKGKGSKKRSQTPRKNLKITWFTARRRRAHPKRIRWRKSLTGKIRGHQTQRRGKDKEGRRKEVERRSLPKGIGETEKGRIKESSRIPKEKRIGRRKETWGGASTSQTWNFESK